MITLDLHGERHSDVDRLVENFVLLNECPLKIITGNSGKMKEIVYDVLKRHGFRWRYELNSHLPRHYNYGSLIVTEK